MWSKPKSSKSHRQSNPKSSKSSFKTDQSTKASPKQAKAASSDTQAIKYQGPSPLPDMSLFWKGMTRDKVQANPTSKIIAVVGRDEVKELKKLIEEKKKANKDNIGMYLMGS